LKGENGNLCYTAKGSFQIRKVLGNLSLIPLERLGVGEALLWSRRKPRRDNIQKGRGHV